MGLHTWLSKNGTNKGLLTQTLIAHSQLVPTIGSAWVRATLLALLSGAASLSPTTGEEGLGKWCGYQRAPAHRRTCPGTILFHSLVSAEAITRERLPPCRYPSREAGTWLSQLSLCLAFAQAPCYLGELSWAAGLSRFVHCSSWS